MTLIKKLVKFDFSENSNTLDVSNKKEIQEKNKSQKLNKFDITFEKKLPVIVPDEIKDFKKINLIDLSKDLKKKVTFKKKFKKPKQQPKKLASDSFEKLHKTIKVKNQKSLNENKKIDSIKAKLNPSKYLENIFKSYIIQENLISKNKDLISNFENEKENIDVLLEKLNKKAESLESEVFLESFSFLEDKPVVKKISFKEKGVKNLYAKIDGLLDREKSSLGVNKDLPKPIKSDSKNKSFGLLEEIEVPDIFAIKDDVADIDLLVEDKFITKDDDLDFRSDPSVKILNEDSKIYSSINVNEDGYKNIPNFVFENNQVRFNKELEENINKIKPKQKKTKHFDINLFNENINQEQEEIKLKLKNVNLSKEDDKKLQNKILKLSHVPEPTYTHERTSKVITETPISQKIAKIDEDLVAKKFKDLRERGVDYILPKNAGASSVILKPEMYQEKFSTDNQLFSSLVYTDDIFFSIKDLTKIYDKYSIDDFTYVTIYFDENEGLYYNLIQPELTLEEAKEYQVIKDIFFNTLDKNYYSFKGDKFSLNKYVQKIFDISLNKLSHNISSLQKKLFFKFIQREFFGLGPLTNLLADEKIIEVSCSGEKTNLIVNHLDYGILKTNISFPSIAELNKFVLILTKNIGVYVNVAHPIINGYLPSGYKVEGFYSEGDTSSKGSSFIIKKYLEEPLSPISMINASIASIDVYAYIWSAIASKIKIVLVDIDDSMLFLNSVLLFLPDKQIITVQAYDRLKLPHKNWINRIFSTNKSLDKKTIIEQTISEKPDYVVVDNFSKDIFEYAWYNVDVFCITPENLSEFIEQSKTLNQKVVLIELKKITQNFKEINQVISIKEVVNKKEHLIAEIDFNENKYTINLLSTTIDIVDFLNRKKLIKWMKDSKIYNYKDFNSIVFQYYLVKDELFQKLDIK